MIIMQGKGVLYRRELNLDRLLKILANFICHRINRRFKKTCLANKLLRFTKKFF